MTIYLGSPNSPHGYSALKLIVRLFLVIAVLGGLGAAGWFYFAPSAPAAVPRTTTVARGDVEDTVLATGVLEAKMLVSVGAEVSGRIDTLHVALGQQVSRGDLIAEIDSLNQENAVRGAEAALASVEAQKRIQQANAAQAELALTRARQSAERNLITQVELEAAELAVETAQAQIEQLDAQILQARINVDAANLNLERTRITAPADGTVVAVLVEEGQTVNANSDTPTIVKIANLDTMIVKAEISEADVPRVVPGQRVYFTIMGEPNNRIEAQLIDVEPAPESISSDTAASSTSSAVYYNGRFEVPNPDYKLRISMTAQVTIVLGEAQDVVVVPSSALIETPRGTAVRVYDAAEGRVMPRPVTVGLNNNIVAEIVDGLSEGDEIVDTGSAAPSAGAGQMPRNPGSPFGSGMMPMGPGMLR